MTAAANAALLNVEVNGTRVPYRSAPNCKVCTSGSHRLGIETRIAQGEVYSAIVRSLPAGLGLTPRNLSDHFRLDHMGAQTAALRLVATRQAEKVARPVARLTEAVADDLGFAHVVVEQVKEKIARGEVEPTVRDGLAALRLIAQVESQAGDRHTAHEFVTVMMHLIEMARDIMTPQQWDKWTDRVATNPILRDLMAQHHPPGSVWAIDQSDSA